jgi:hypothetical protein
MPVCLRNGETKTENADKVMTMREPAGRLGEIVRTLKRNHQARTQASRPRGEEPDWEEVG